MQISRHWRMNANRYRLEGCRLPNGELSLQPLEGRIHKSHEIKIVSEINFEIKNLPFALEFINKIIEKFESQEKEVLNQDNSQARRK